MAIIVWCTCPPRHPGTGQNKTGSRCPLKVTHFRKPGVLALKCLVPEVWNRHMMALPDHLLYIIYYNGRLQRYHSLFIPYKEDISFLHYKACVEWGEGPGPSQNRSWKRNKRKGKTALPFMGSFGFPHLSNCNSSSSAPSPHSFLSSGSRDRSMAKQCLGEAL